MKSEHTLRLIIRALKKKSAYLNLICFLTVLTNAMAIGVLTFYFVRVGSKSTDNVTGIMVTVLILAAGAFVIQNRRIALMREICKYERNV